MIDDGKKKLITSATQKVKAPAASQGVQRKLKLQDIDEEEEESSSDKPGESVF